MASLASSASGASASPTRNLQDTTAFVNAGTCEAERFLVEQSNRWTTLFALCIGLDETLDDGLTKKPLLDLNESPFKSLKKKDIKPSLECLKEEVKRRSGLEVNRAKNIPKPNGWSAPKCIEWLKDNPITTNDDVAFLYRKEKEVKEIVANATQKAPAASANQSLDGEPGNKWFGPLPYLRLIHCLFEDDIKE